MHKSNKNTFLESAFILVLANAIVKVIGAIFKIPMTNLLGSYGMGIFNMGYQVYATLFVISTAGLPVAVSKMVSEANSLGKHKEVRSIVRITLIIFTVVGMIGSLILFFGSTFLVELFAGENVSEQAYFSVITISPSLFFVAIASTIRGYYQGLNNMVPTGISQVIEALLKLFAGYGLAYALLLMGKSEEIAAAGALFGVTLGTVLSSVYLVIKLKREGIRATSVRKNIPSLSPRGIILKLIKTAVPVTIGAAVISLTSLIDTALVMRRLQTIGYSADESLFLFGAYTSMPISIFNLPQTLITAISISVIPAITTAFAKNNVPQGIKTINSAMKIAVLIALPCAVGLNVLARQILNLLYSRPEEVLVAYPQLEILAFAVVFVALVSLTNATLQAMSHATIPVTHMLIGGIIKIVANYILVGIPEININGAPIGTTLCYFTISMLNLRALYKINGTLPAIVPTFIKPLIASLGMGASAVLTFNLISVFLGEKIGTILAILVAMVVYVVLLVLVKAITREDAELMPKGDKIIKILKLK